MRVPFLQKIVFTLTLLLSKLGSTVQQEAESNKGIIVNENTITSISTTAAATRNLNTMDVNKWNKCNPIDKTEAAKVTNKSKKKCKTQCINSDSCKAFQYKKIPKKSGDGYRKICWLLDHATTAVPVIQRKNRIWCGIKTPTIPTAAPSASPNSSCSNSGDGIIIPMYIWPESDGSGCTNSQVSSLTLSI